MRRIGAIVNRGSGHGRGGHMERWLRLRLGEQLDLLEITQGVDLAGWAAPDDGFADRPQLRFQPDARRLQEEVAVDAAGRDPVGATGQAYLGCLVGVVRKAERSGDVVVGPGRHQRQWQLHALHRIGYRAEGPVATEDQDPLDAEGLALPEVVSIAKAVRVVMPDVAETSGTGIAGGHQDHPSEQTEEEG